MLHYKVGLHSSLNNHSVFGPSDDPFVGMHDNDEKGQYRAAIDALLSRQAEPDPLPLYDRGAIELTPEEQAEVTVRCSLLFVLTMSHIAHKVYSQLCRRTPVHRGCLGLYACISPC